MKKSQLKIMESIFVLIIFFFLLVFGLGFYAKFSKMESGSDMDEQMKRNALETAQRLQHLPELQCTKDGDYVEADCIDMYKLEAFSKRKDSYFEVYSKYFPDTLVKVQLVYPKHMQKEWVIYNYTSNSSSSGLKYYLPTSLYNATADMYRFGYVMIEARY